MNLLNMLYTLSPKDWAKKISNKLGFDGDRQSIDEVLTSSKHMRSQRVYDFHSRYETIITRNRPWTPIDFKKQKVLEIGAGPVMGSAPLAVFLGCNSYTCIEPGWNSKILDSPAFTRYLLGVHKDLTAIYGSYMTFEVFLELLNERVRVVAKKLLEAEVDGPFEVALSNSCLEHIMPLDQTIQKLKTLLSPKSRFMHSVDFGNHSNSANPFDNIYTVKPEEYFLKHGDNINLHRRSDILQMFRDAGIDTAFLPYYYYKDSYQQQPIDYWTSRYSEEDLFLKCGFFVDTVDLSD